MRTEPVRTIAPFWGGVKSAALMFYSTPKTVAKVNRLTVIYEFQLGLSSSVSTSDSLPIHAFRSPACIIIQKMTDQEGDK